MQHRLSMEHKGSPPLPNSLRCKCNILLQGITCCAENICRCNLFGSNCRVKTLKFCLILFTFLLLWFTLNFSHRGLNSMKDIRNSFDAIQHKHLTTHWISTNQILICLLAKIYDLLFSASGLGFLAGDKLPIDNNSLQRRRKAGQIYLSIPLLAKLCCLEFSSLVDYLKIGLATWFVIQKIFLETPTKKTQPCGKKVSQLLTLCLNFFFAKSRYMFSRVCAI